jgi:hypothetical protein
LTPIAEMVERMIAAGVAADMVVLAVATAERIAIDAACPPDIPPDTAADKRRAYDRNRKAKVRNVHRTSTGLPPDTETPSLSIESKKEESKEEREAPKRASRGQRLPDDWSPSAQDAAVALTLVGPQRTAAELDKFRDHWKQQPGSKGVKLDWDAAWRNWIRRSAEYGAKNNGRRTVHDAAKDLTRTLERIAEFDEPAPSGLCLEEGGNAVRLLPPR